eukprot:TRINITY_DN21020_c0_g1_i1.p1 TRINITY_DN21020_c0_g1~~TRINITY_DN21020_c0_g1_i1.p1  ORF type:complete len:235 (+),score=24.49 TRINITY_DN21020_c0_g1_i1:87-707(+)
MMQTYIIRHPAAHDPPSWWGGTCHWSGSYLPPQLRQQSPRPYSPPGSPRPTRHPRPPPVPPPARRVVHSSYVPPQPERKFDVIANIPREEHGGGELRRISWASTRERLRGVQPPPLPELQPAPPQTTQRRSRPTRHCSVRLPALPSTQVTPAPSAAALLVAAHAPAPPAAHGADAPAIAAYRSKRLAATSAPARQRSEVAPCGWWS